MHNIKSCVTCKTTENISASPYVTRRGVGYYFCKSCTSDRMKKYYDKHKLAVFGHYGRICACCGEDEYDFLSIDHINNDGHLEKWPSGRIISGKQLYQKIVKAGLPNTYQVLCMNCNFGKRMNKGVCPHKNKKSVDR